MNKEDLTLNNLQRLISHKTKPYHTKLNYASFYGIFSTLAGSGTTGLGPIYGSNRTMYLC